MTSAGDRLVPRRLLIFCGIPGSGKTTIARLVAKADPTAVHIQTDTIRAMIAAPTFSPSESDLVYSAAVAVAKKALDADRMVILDATFGSKARRDKTLEPLTGHYSRVDFVYVVCDLQTALRRNAARGGREAVPEDTVTDILTNFDDPPGALKVDSSKMAPKVAAEEVIRKLLRPSSQ